jgi:ATP-dependent DNA helicase DinG
MRERAAEADLVIVNHHLLCADAAVREREFGEVIPDCDLAVIDEAHQLEDVATQYFGVSLSTTRVDDFVRDATRSLAPLVKDDRDGAMGAVVRQLGDLHQAARRVFDAARSAITGREGAGERVRLTPELSTDLHDVASALDGALERLAALLAPLVEHRDAAAIGERARAMLADLRVFTTVDEQGHVRFVEGRGRGVSLRAAPIDVSSIIRDTILGRRRSTVLTSATLAVGGTFDYALSRLGLAGASTLQLPSEFDYRRQTLLYLPEEMPDPRSRDFNAAAAREITALLTRTRGRAFVLFTSYAAMRDVHAQLPEDAWPIFVQGTGPRSALLREFRATPHAVLLATASFWQGVDVPGEALSAVIIDRLPFASPGDPLVAARIAAIETRGGNAFSEYQVPLATLTLLQGLGRLIRARTDRGVLAVLDPRLTRMRYGQRFLASMPSAPITNDLARVARFFEET